MTNRGLGVGEKSMKTIGNRSMGILLLLALMAAAVGCAP